MYCYMRALDSNSTSILIYDVDTCLTTGIVISMPTYDEIWEMVYQLDSRLKAGFRKFYAESDANKRYVNAVFTLMEQDPYTTIVDVELMVKTYFPSGCAD